jgi:beta-galactosidase
MKLSDGTKQISQNFYNTYIQNQSILTAPIKTALRVAVLKPEDDLGNKLIGILADLHIDAKQISSVSDISGYDVLIVPPADKTHSILNPLANRKAIMKWVSNGGLVLALEQNYTGRIWFGQTITDCQNTLTDLVLPQHPIFAGLTQQEFDTWDNTDYGNSIKRGLSPFTKNAIAARPPQLGTSGVFNAVAEGSIGKGRVLLSQLSATSLWNKDSVASTYLRNLLAYVLSGKPADTVRSWEANREEVELSLEEAVPIDLKPYTNRGFADDIASDEKGGWTDQGNNDFSTVQPGLKTLNGVPFNIIDPASNNNKSCIVLKGANRQYFPASVSGIKIGLKASHLYFLHALAWGGASSEVAHYQVNYTDGSTVNIPIIDGQNIADWFTPGSLPEAESGIAIKNPAGHEVRLWLHAWKNPKPSTEIQTIDFISNTNGPVPVLAAITGRKVESE